MKLQSGLETGFMNMMNRSFKPIFIIGQIENYSHKYACYKNMVGPFSISTHVGYTDLLFDINAIQYTEI